MNAVRRLPTKASGIKTRYESWARLVSDLLSPPVIWGVIAFAVAAYRTDNPNDAFIWGLLYTVIVCVFPAAYVGWMVKRGVISDVHMANRSERYRPFVVTCICTVFAWAMLSVLGAPEALPLYALFSLVQVVIMLAITLFWQISFHTMSISGAVTIAGILYGASTFFTLSPLIGLVALARLNLHRHTRAQVVAGITLGGVMTYILYRLTQPFWV